MDREMSTAALIVSIISLLCCGLPFGIAGIVLVIVARRREGEFNAKTILALVFSIIGLLASLASGIYYALYLSELMRELEEAFEGAGGTVLLPARASLA